VVSISGKRKGTSGRRATRHSGEDCEEAGIVAGIRSSILLPIASGRGVHPGPDSDPLLTRRYSQRVNMAFVFSDEVIYVVRDRVVHQVAFEIVIYHCLADRPVFGGFAEDVVFTFTGYPCNLKQIIFNCGLPELIQPQLNPQHDLGKQIA
jgi:hypothetical protein